VGIATQRGDRAFMAKLLESMSRLLFGGVKSELVELIAAWFAVDCRVGQKVGCLGR